MKETNLKSEVKNPLVFDVGMYDGSDTEYYLESGYRVVAIEANPNLANAARQRFANDVANGRLTVVNAAIAEGEDEVELTICGEDLGSSSTIGSMVVDRIPMGSYKVPAIGFAKLVEQFGVPDYLKIDIEGADGICVVGITAANRPPLLSFEVGNDFLALLDHLSVVGYTEYKLISQLSFRESSREGLLGDRIRRKIMRMMGYSQPGLLRVRGRNFKVAHSSGPGPWASDGAWVDKSAIAGKWKQVRGRGRIGNWYDLHAR
jgi:FkbM family methyltransferase